MHAGLTEKLQLILESTTFFVPELVLCGGILLLIIAGLFKTTRHQTLAAIFGLIIFASATLLIVYTPPSQGAIKLFGGMIQHDGYATYFKLLFDVAALLTLLMSWKQIDAYRSEYYVLLLSVVLGAHVLVMSINFVMIFLSLELISLSSYVLTRFAFTQKSAEGSLKYFIFGSVASAVMVYGFSLLYGLSGTLNITSVDFINNLLEKTSPLLFIGGLFSLAGFLFKIAAAPMHPWAPDVYEAAPIPVIAFFSVVPKLAGLGVLTRFILALNLFGQYNLVDWQIIISVIALLTLTIGNFSALWQQNPKRMMAYSSIAQSGFLLVGVAAFMPQAIHFMLFYAAVFLISNFLVFWYLHFFESRNAHVMENYSGYGRVYIWPSILLLVGFVALTGLPPTAGFTAKLFIFSGLWEAYATTGKPILLWLLIFGLLNTVVSLFYYLRIPYYAFLKPAVGIEPQKTPVAENLFGLLLVLGILYLFFQPDLLMGWINKINFVL